MLRLRSYRAYALNRLLRFRRKFQSLDLLYGFRNICFNGVNRCKSRHPVADEELTCRSARITKRESVLSVRNSFCKQRFVRRRVVKTKVIPYNAVHLLQRFRRKRLSVNLVRKRFAREYERRRGLHKATPGVITAPRLRRPDYLWQGQRQNNNNDKNYRHNPKSFRAHKPIVFKPQNIEDILHFVNIPSASSAAPTFSTKICSSVGSTT